MKSRSASLSLLGICSVLACLVSPARAQVDIEAERAYLRTGVNEGSEVTTPALGQQVFVHLDYRLTGTNAPVTVAVRALVDGVEQCSGAIELAPNADEVIWCPRAFMATAGAHTLRWELDTQNSVAEGNENNNVAELHFTTAGAGSRDLEALRAYLRTQINSGDEVPSPTLGQQVYFHVDYRVGGSGADFSAGIKATIDDQAFCSGPITFSPGMEGVVWCPTAWTATAGTHTLRWELDGDHAISETDETNNVAQVTFTTEGPNGIDIVAQRAFLRTQVNAGSEVTQPAVGQDVYFHIEYEIVGGTAQFTAGVRALIDDQEHCSGDIDFDPAQAGTVWCSDAWTATAGSHTLRWMLDSDNAIAESNENNNSAATTFIVGGAVSCIGDCDESNTVTVSELVTGVNITLERADIGTCTAFDSNGNGRVTVDELVTGVGNLLHGCP